jgi:hypothetical protein
VLGLDLVVAFRYHSSMSQPVKISDDLLLEARLTGELLKRSIAGQIEFWASLGRAIEPLLAGDRLLALQKSGKIRPLSEVLGSVDSPLGRRRVSAYLHEQPYPHYEPAPGKKGFLVRIDRDGKRTVGRFVGRRFKRAR